MGQWNFNQQGSGDGRWVHPRQREERSRGQHGSSGRVSGRDRAAANEGSTAGEKSRHTESQPQNRVVRAGPWSPAWQHG